MNINSSLLQGYSVHQRVLSTVGIYTAVSYERYLESSTKTLCLMPYPMKFILNSHDNNRVSKLGYHADNFGKQKVEKESSESK